MALHFRTYRLLLYDSSRMRASACRSARLYIGPGHPGRGAGPLRGYAMRGHSSHLKFRGTVLGVCYLKPIARQITQGAFERANSGTAQSNKQCIRYRSPQPSIVCEFRPPSASTPTPNRNLDLILRGRSKAEDIRGFPDRGFASAGF